MLNELHLVSRDTLKSSIRWLSLLAVVTLIVTLIVASSSVRAQQVSAPGTAQRWLQGREFHHQLDAEVGVVWQSNPLRVALRNLAKSQRVAIMLDRRLDPGLPVDFSTQGASLRTVLRRFGEKHDLQICLIDSVIYAGPSGVMGDLATLAALRRQDVARLPAAAKSKLQKRVAFAWDELTTPRELLRGLAQEAGVEIKGVTRVPHDLWPSTSLSSLVWSDRMTLVLAGFNATFRISDDGKTVELLRIPKDLSYTGIVSARRLSASAVEKLAEKFPQVEIKNTARGVQVRGRFEDFDRIARLLRGEPIKREQPNRGLKRYSLKIVNQPVGPVLQALAKRLSLEVEFAPTIPEKTLHELVSFEVKDVTHRQLLTAAAAPAGLRVQLNGQRLTVSEK